MKEILVFCTACLLLFSCKDEFNIPVSNSYVDGDAPEVTLVVSPLADKVYTGESELPINFIVEDDFFLQSIEVEIRDMGTSQNIFEDKVLTNDSIYSYSSVVVLPKDTTNFYELYITVKDEVENVNYKTIPFSTK